MRWVDQAALHPHRCAVLPYVGNSSTTRGFLDTGVDVDLDRIYLSGEFFEHVIPLMGFVPEGRVKGLERKVDDLNAKVAELEAEVAGHVRFREAAEYTLGQFGSKVRNKPGRKPEKAVA